MALAIGMQSYMVHGGFGSADLQSLERANMIHVINSCGFCFLSLKKQNKLKILPGSLLLGGTVMFSYLLYYSKVKQDRQFNWLLPYGGGMSMLGWALMVLV